jgi:hypothetical protein
MNRAILIVLFVLLHGFIGLWAEEQPLSGVLYGPGWSCTIIAPKGWILDNHSWENQGIYAIFYEKGARPVWTTPVIYFNAERLEAASDQALDKYISDGVKGIKKNPKNTVRELPRFKMPNGELIRVFVFNHNEKLSWFEEIAFVRYKDGVHLVVLKTLTEKEIKDLEPKLFESLNNLSFADRK